MAMKPKNSNIDTDSISINFSTDGDGSNRKVEVILRDLNAVIYHRLPTGLCLSYEQSVNRIQFRFQFSNPHGDLTARAITKSISIHRITSTDKYLNLLNEFLLKISKFTKGFYDYPMLNTDVETFNIRSINRYINIYPNNNTIQYYDLVAKKICYGGTNTAENLALIREKVAENNEVIRTCLVSLTDIKNSINVVSRKL